ncbi:FtsX-like permease family protein [Kineococcus sp. SYSU DK005]|uniref:FtsX-like permease family protein n=1 Tax=Kineococcus sp. SYSU DK005 TaxID=3383126 RepID=UPI003D7EDE4A
MSGALRTWLRLLRHRDSGGHLPTVLAVVAFAAATWAVLTVAGGVQAFTERARLAGPGSDAALYPLLAAVSVALLVVPTAALGGAAARLTVARRDERLARLRLAGATSAQTGLVALLDAGLQAVAGAVAGVVLNLLATPLLAQLRFQGRAFEPSELRLGALPVLVTAGAVLLVSLVSCAVSLRRVVVTPLGVAQRLPAKALSWVRVLPVLLVGLAFTAAFRVLGQLTAGVGLAGAVLVLAVLLAATFALYNLVGPFLLSVLGRVLAARARSVPTLLAARRIADDPRSAWRGVGGIALVTFVAGCLSVVPGMTATDGGDVEGEALLRDVGTGALVTLVVAAVLAAVSTGVTQASRVLDGAPQHRALHLAGADVAVLHAARSRETWVPLALTTGGAALTALLVVSPLLAVLRSAPVGVLLFAACAAGGAGLVLLASRAARPLLAQSVDLSRAPR